MNELLSLSAPFVLASQSPRRRALLKQIGLDFTVQVSPVEETTDEPMPPKEMARALATKKARPVAARHPSSVVLSADTVVIHEGVLLEKPSSPAHARRMLRRLSDTTHTVYTGMALHHTASDRRVATGQATTVTFGVLTDAEIRAYVATKSPMDKAGGYGIQDHTGPLFVDHLEGDYYNVVGLPLRHLYQTLQEHFSDVLEH
jgi:septum formation protein